MREEERKLREVFGELSKRTSPRMLTDLHYGVIHRVDKPDLVDFNTLVGFIDTATQFSVNILNEGERALKIRIINSLRATISLLEENIERLR